MGVMGSAAEYPEGQAPMGVRLEPNQAWCSRCERTYSTHESCVLDWLWWHRMPEGCRWTEPDPWLRRMRAEGRP